MTEVTAETLSAIRADLGQTMREFGLTLKRVLEPGAAHGFSKNYVSMMERGAARITPRIARATLVLMAMLDGVDEVQARAQPVKVLAVGNIDGAIVFGDARPCALAGCRVRFVPRSWNHAYHSPACKREAKRRDAVRQRHKER
jgi:hypothetical protein